VVKVCAAETVAVAVQNTNTVQINSQETSLFTLDPIPASPARVEG